jgi:hypothetical protein
LRTFRVAPKIATTRFKTNVGANPD